MKTYLVRIRLKHFGWERMRVNAISEKAALEIAISKIESNWTIEQTSVIELGEWEVSKSEISKLNVGDSEQPEPKEEEE
jgi:hypothetical protein